MSTIPPSKQTSAQVSDAQTATSGHPPATALDPTLTSNDAAQGGNPSAHATGPAKLARLRSELKAGLRQFPDFPSPGILFEDIMPLFADVKLHTALIDALVMLVRQHYNEVDVVVGLDSRGFLFGPSLALRLNAAFVPVRKQGKLPGPCETEGFKKEYGEDFFQLQSDAIKPGQKVLVVDDIIATGGSAAAAGNLVAKTGGNVLGFIFLMELDFLKGRDKLNGPTHTLLSGQEAALNSS